MRSTHEEAAEIETRGGPIRGTLAIPAGARGAVIFAHGSGSGRLSPRNVFVAEVLQKHGLATLLIDLLTPGEERVDAITAEHRFDIDLLAGRLAAATDWLTTAAARHDFRLGFFGASTGAAAALVAAADRPDIAAVVSRGGRPDLAGNALRRVTAATLLIVGGRDVPVIAMNRSAYEQLVRASHKELTIVPGATHLFQEPGTLEEVARLAANWFVGHLGDESGREQRASGGKHGTR